MFVYLFICKVTTTKANFVFRNSAVKPQHVLFANESFLRKMLVSFFSSNIPLNIEKNPMEEICKVLKIKFKTWNPVDPKFVFKKNQIQSFALYST